jgi:hypothetical protein
MVLITDFIGIVPLVGTVQSYNSISGDNIYSDFGRIILDALGFFYVPNKYASYAFAADGIASIALLMVKFEEGDGYGGVAVSGGKTYTIGGTKVVVSDPYAASQPKFDYEVAKSEALNEQLRQKFGLPVGK